MKRRYASALVPSLLCSLLTGAISCAKLAPQQPPYIIPDTTSHLYAWHVDYVGEGLGNEFLDVAVLNDTLAYAVGRFFQNDSSGNLDPILYNVAVWNGKSWTPRRLYYHFGTDSSTGEIHSIFALNEHDIWFGFGNLVHWDGKSYQSYEIIPPLPPSWANRIWGSSDSDIYVVGEGGGIVHYNGSTWTALEAGTQLEVFDIWGATDPTTRRQQILAVASNDFALKVLSISASSASAVQDSGLAPCVGLGVWFVPNQKYYVVGAGIGQKNNLDASRWSVYQSGVVTSFASDFVRGRAMNDVFVGGSYLELVHFNGSSWYNYRNVFGRSDGALASCSMTSDLVIVVGFAGQSAVAAVGRKIVE